MSHRQFYSSFCGLHDSCEPIKKLRDVYHPDRKNTVWIYYLVDMLIIMKERILCFIII